jgi:hypothetical protein
MGRFLLAMSLTPVLVSVREGSVHHLDAAPSPDLLKVDREILGPIL